MPTADFSGRDVIKLLRKHDYQFVTRTGSHVRMGYVADDGEVRTVTVPMHDRIKTNTLRNIADTLGYTHVSSFATPSWRNRSRRYSRQYDQCGANDFDERRRWIDEHARIPVGWSSPPGDG